MQPGRTTPSRTRAAKRSRNSRDPYNSFIELTRPHDSNLTTLISIDTMEAEQSHKGCRLLRGRISIPPSKSKRTVGTCCEQSSRRRSPCLIVGPVASRFRDGGCLYRHQPFGSRGAIAPHAEKRWQATRRSEPDSFSNGTSTRHRSIANAQRGWKQQPDGGSSRLGTSPATTG